MKKILIFLLCSGCAIKSVEEACSEEQMKSVYSSYNECHRDLTNKRMNAFNPGIEWSKRTYEAPREEPRKRLDMICMKDCRDLGYMYKNCERKCEY